MLCLHQSCLALPCPVQSSVCLQSILIYYLVFFISELEDWFFYMHFFSFNFGFLYYWWKGSLHHPLCSYDKRRHAPHRRKIGEICQSFCQFLSWTYQDCGTYTILLIYLCGTYTILLIHRFRTNFITQSHDSFLSELWCMIYIAVDISLCNIVQFYVLKCTINNNFELTHWMAFFKNPITQIRFIIYLFNDAL